VTVWQHGLAVFMPPLAGAKLDRLLLRFLTTLLLIFSTVPAAAQVASSRVTEDTWKFLMSVKWSKGPQALSTITDPNTRIAIGWRRVLTGEITE